MAIPYNIMSAVHEHTQNATPLPGRLQRPMPKMHNSNAPSHLSQNAMPVHLTSAVDPLTTEYRSPNVTPTGAIDYPESGSMRR